MSLRLEVEHPRLPYAAHLGILGSTCTRRHRRVRKIRQAFQRRGALVFDRVELDAQLLDLLGSSAAGLLDRGRVETLTACPGNFVAGCVLLSLQTLDFGYESAAGGLEGRDLLERLVRVETAAAQAGAHLLDVVANVRGIKHQTFIVYARAAAFVCYHRPVKRTIRKAVFPAAGLGTRFLPATKAQPKEMLPLVDKPIIQYGVEEALASGVSNIILVTGRGKNAIEDHFDVSVELESFLEARGKHELAVQVHKISNLINFAYVRQGEPLGLGHAVLVARELVGDEPFAVILGDDVIDARPPALRQMIDVYERLDGPVLAVERVPREDISKYGVIAPRAGTDLGAGVYTVEDLVEKPSQREAPSDLAIIGRYILTPDIFPSLSATKSDRTGEIQLTNGIRDLLKARPVYACEIDGVRHDTGNKLGYLKAVVYFALRRPDLADHFSEYLRSLSLEVSQVKPGTGH